MTDTVDTEAVETDEAVEIETRYGQPVTYSRGQTVIHVPRDQWRATAEALFVYN